MKNQKRILISLVLIIGLVSASLFVIPIKLNNQYTYTPPLLTTAGAHATINNTVLTPYKLLNDCTLVKSLGTFKVTAYCACEICCQHYALARPVDEAGNAIVVGASGEVLIPEYSVAVDPTVIPYGTVLYIEDKEYIAHDCGSAIKDNCIDVYYTDHTTANQQGVQYLEIFIEVKEEP